MNFIILLMTAVMLSLPFCFEKMWALAWVSQSVLVYSVFCRKMSLKRVFCSLFCFFYLFYFCVYSWFVNLYPLDFAGLENGESIVVILCGIFLIPLIQSVLMSVCVFFGYLVCLNAKSDAVKAVTFACAYVPGEFLQTLGTFAFPWTKLSLTQTARLENLQSTSLFGGYFTSFLMVLVSGMLAFSFAKFKNGNKKRAFGILLCVVLVFGINFVYGKYEMNKQVQYKNVNVVALQGNIASGEKWQDDADHKGVYMTLANAAKEELAKENFKPDITILPETAFPVTLVRDGNVPYSSGDDAGVLFDIADTLDTVLFAGAFCEKDKNTYNSVFSISSNGKISLPYNKHNIVPFGEFLPYRNLLVRVLPFLESVNMLSSDLARGEEYIPIQTQKVNAGVLVCFDSIFEKTARLQVKNGAEILCVSTNDSWYKTSPALYQHARHSILRAIENRVCVVRSANTGISLISDECGRIIEKTNVNERTFINATIRVSEKRSMYTQIGDVFVFVCFAWILVLLVAKIKNSRTKVRENK